MWLPTKKLRYNWEVVGAVAAHHCTEEMGFGSFPDVWMQRTISPLIFFPLTSSATIITEILVHGFVYTSEDTVATNMNLPKGTMEFMYKKYQRCSEEFLKFKMQWGGTCFEISFNRSSVTMIYSENEAKGVFEMRRVAQEFE